MKEKACADVGIASYRTALPESASEVEIMGAIRKYNLNPCVHGVLVQLPLPPHIDAKRVLLTVSLDKDVDGFHPWHVGDLCMKVCCLSHV